MERAAEIRQHLFSLTPRGIKYDLERMNAAAQACGNPQNVYPSFHVAGTNGKGSICSYLESGLRSCGFRTGLFTSPHLIRFEERFMIDGRPIHEPVWLHAYRDLQPVIERFQLTFFEAATLMAFEIFRKEKVQWAVFETGLGGRLDATNVVVPAVSVISHIALDHMDYLGGDVASIAAEKLGIVKHGVPLVMAEPDDEAIGALAVERCNKIGTSCQFVSRADCTDCRGDPEGAAFSWEDGSYRINLKGEYQVTNALLALYAMKAAGFNDHRAIAQGVENARLPGRFQVMAFRDRRLIFDVGHNPDAAQAFCGSLREQFSNQPVCFVLGIMKDKDITGMMDHYAAVARRIICTAPATERAAAPESLKDRVPDTFKGGLLTAATVASAVDSAFTSPEEVICIAGSFFTVGEAMEYLKIEPYKY